MPTTIEYLDRAIAELKLYRSNERDADKRDLATSKIAGLILDKQKAASDDMQERSAALQSAVARLQAIIDGAGDGPGIADSLGEVSSLIGEIQATPASD